MTKSANLISVLARGDQEMFHSAFLAWLMDDSEGHGLGASFRTEILGRLEQAGASIPFSASADLEVLREHVEGPLRFDILLRPSNQTETGLVLENKTKSIGESSQLRQYSDAGYTVAWLGLIEESFSRETRQRFPGLPYRQVYEALKATQSNAREGYAFVISEYVAYLDASLGLFEALRDFSHGSIELQGLVNATKAAAETLEFRDNDIRNLAHFWHYGLSEYLAANRPELCFGADNYDEAKRKGSSTRWLFEKNMQGGPFMEALVVNCATGASGLLLHEELRSACDPDTCIAPRLELWPELDALLVAKEDTDVGSILLGTWTPKLKRVFRETPAWTEKLSQSPRWTRNFHRDRLKVGDLRFAVASNRIQTMLEKIGTVLPLDERST